MELVMTNTQSKSRSDVLKKPAEVDTKLLVSRREAAAWLSISQRSLDYLIANKELTTKRIGSRVLIPIHDLRRFARSDHPQRLAS